MVALLTVLLYALNPSAILFSTSIMSEPIYLLLLLLWFYLEKREANGWLMGLFSGILVLTRSVFIGMVPAWLFLHRRNLHMQLAFGLIFLIVLLANGSWNKMEHGHFTVTTKQMGFGLFQGIELDGMDDDTRGTLWIQKTKLNFDRDYLKLDRETFHEALRIVRERPGDYARMVVWKVFKFWRPIPRKYSGVIKIGSLMYYCPLLLLACMGMFWAWSVTSPLVYWLFFYTTVLHAFHCETLRYRMPLEPFLCYFAAVALVRWWESWEFWQW